MQGNVTILLVTKAVTDECGGVTKVTKAVTDECSGVTKVTSN